MRLQTVHWHPMLAIQVGERRKAGVEGVEGAKVYGEWNKRGKERVRIGAKERK